MTEENKNQDFKYLEIETIRNVTLLAEVSIRASERVSQLEAKVAQLQEALKGQAQETLTQDHRGREILGKYDRLTLALEYLLGHDQKERLVNTTDSLLPTKVLMETFRRELLEGSEEMQRTLKEIQGKESGPATIADPSTIADSDGIPLDQDGKDQSILDSEEPAPGFTAAKWNNLREQQKRSYQPTSTEERTSFDDFVTNLEEVHGRTAQLREGSAVSEKESVSGPGEPDPLDPKTFLPELRALLRSPQYYSEFYGMLRRFIEEQRDST